MKTKIIEFQTLVKEICTENYNTINPEAFAQITIEPVLTKIKINNYSIQTDTDEIKRVLLMKNTSINTLVEINNNKSQKKIIGKDIQSAGIQYKNINMEFKFTSKHNDLLIKLNSLNVGFIFNNVRKEFLDEINKIR